MPTNYMALTLPVEGGSSGTWDTLLTTLIELIDSHDHSADKGKLVRSNGISINANLTFAGWCATQVAAIGFAERISAGTPTIPNQSLWVSSVDDELYWRRAGGTDVKVTAGAALNVSIVGGITGDYSAAGASFYYDDANKRYKALRSVSPDFWASVATGDLELLEKASGISNKVTLKSPAALAASYSLSFPAALPVGKRAVQCSAIGGLTFDNAFSGAASFDSSVAATGAVSGNGFTATANANVTISGTGEYKHGDRVLAIHPFDGWPGSTAVSPNNSGYAQWSLSGTLSFGATLLQGDRIKSVTFARYGDGVADFDVGIAVITAAGASTLINPGAVNTLVSNPGAAWADTTIDVTDTTIAAGESLYMYFIGNATGLRLGSIRVTYDRP